MNSMVNYKAVSKDRDDVMNKVFRAMSTRGMSIEELAKASGLDVNTIYHWRLQDVACSRGPSLYNFLTVLKALDLKIDLVPSRKARLLSLNELRMLMPGTSIWEEYVEDEHEHDHLIPALIARPGLIITQYRDEVEITDNLLQHDDWGFQQRYWSAKPTGAQMKEAKWE